MKTFFGGNFIKEEMLSEAGIYHPIKLEENKAKFGICIIKTEYKTKEKIIEEKEIKYLTNDEKRVNQVLNMLKENYVTPIGLEDVICDYAKEIMI